MPFIPTPPTHHCERCGKALWNNRWPYSLCKVCAKLPCKHGNKHGECGKCDFEADMAYDASKGN